MLVGGTNETLDAVVVFTR